MQPHEAGDDPVARGTRPHVAWFLGPIAALVVAANIGTALAPTLVVNAPLLLIALDARNRHLLLVAAADVPLWAFLVIGFVRLMAPDPFFYALGMHYGEPAWKWAEQRLGIPPTTRDWVERAFAKAGKALVLIMPNNPVCLLAGVVRMPPRVFWPLDVVGTLGRLALFWWLGDLFRGPLQDLLDLIARYQVPLLIVSVVVVVLQASIRQRRGETPVESPEHLVEELEQAAEDLAAESELRHFADELDRPAPHARPETRPGADGGPEPPGPAHPDRR